MGRGGGVSVRNLGQWDCGRVEQSEESGSGAEGWWGSWSRVGQSEENGAVGGG